MAYDQTSMNIVGKVADVGGNPTTTPNEQVQSENNQTETSITHQNTLAIELMSKNEEISKLQVLLLERNKEISKIRQRACSNRKMLSNSRKQTSAQESVLQ